MENSEQATKSIKPHIAYALSICDSIIITLVAIGIIGAAVILLYDTATDFVYLGTPNHTLSHIVNDLMLILIIMELLRQVLRLIRSEPFSIAPFLAISIIASVRGFLVTQIKLGLSEAEWLTGLINLGAYSAMIIAFVACFYFFTRKTKE